jgi:3-deoxy-D-manno-octulosonate 8-phosphate phosphatase (KDO 8-P phosphatase)
MESYKIGLNKIKCLVFDVDGVFTDGSVYLLKDETVRVLNSRDRLAVQYASQAGLKVFVISGGNTIAVKIDLEKFGATEVCLGVKDKLKKYEELLSEYDLKDEEVLYMGDDLPDLPVLKRVGVSSCPANAASDIKSIVDYVSKYDGGKFAVRDVIEQTLRVQKKWLN